MEDADKEAEQVVNIDACDEKNSLAVVEYIDDIYDFHKKSEVSLIFFCNTKLCCSLTSLGFKVSRS